MSGLTQGRLGAVGIVLAALLLASAAGAGASGAAGQPEPPQEEFVPIDQVPPEDRLPAAPLLVSAYALVWLAVFGYLWSIWRRLSGVERDMSELSRRAAGGGED